MTKAKPNRPAVVSAIEFVPSPLACNRCFGPALGVTRGVDSLRPDQAGVAGGGEGLDYCRELFGAGVGQRGGPAWTGRLAVVPVVPAASPGVGEHGADPAGSIGASAVSRLTRAKKAASHLPRRIMLELCSFVPHETAEFYAFAGVAQW